MRFRPDVLVCDEGHLLKNANTVRAKALALVRTKRRLVLTGTPMQVLRDAALCPLPAARCPLPASRCPLPAARCPLPAARCPLPAARCPLPSLICQESPLLPYAAPLRRTTLWNTLQWWTLSGSTFWAPRSFSATNLVSFIRILSFSRPRPRPRP
jgi:hypothetical protein